MNPSRLAAKLMLAFTFAVGAATVWMMICAFLSESLGQSELISYQSVVFDLKGNPIIQEYNYQHQARTYQTLTGEPLDLPNDHPTLPAARIAPARRDSSWFDYDRPYPYLVPYNDGGAPAVFWYYMQDRRPGARGYFIGYDSLSNRIVGYITRSGFRTESPADVDDMFRVPTDRFGIRNAFLKDANHAYYADLGIAHEPWGSGYSTVPGIDLFSGKATFVDGDDIVHVSLRSRDAPPKVLFSADGIGSPIHLAGVQYEAGAVDNADVANADAVAEERQVLLKQKDAIVASAGNEVLIFTPADDQLRRFALPADVAGEGFTMFRTIAGDVIVQKEDFDRFTNVTHELIYTLSPSGEVLHRQEFDLSRRSRESGLMPLLMGFAIPFPIGSMTLTGVLIPLSEMDNFGVSYSAAVRKAFAETGLFVPMTFVLAALCTWRCVIRQRRYGDPAIVPWAIFVFITGVPGYLGYLAHRRWPVRLPCPACTSRTPRDRTSCLDCGAPFPAPEMKGIEIFA